jgi:hypothetical protein
VASLNDVLFAQSGKVRWAITQYFGEHSFGVLAQQGWREIVAHRRATEFEGAGHQIHWPAHGMLPA